jgi:hypothetical protein
MARHLKADTYVENGTWVCPVGVTQVTIEAWGAGGGSKAGTGGGGGGAYSRSTIDVTPGTSYAVTVGQSDVDTNGGDSSFETDVVAQGGRSASNGGTGGAASSGTGSTRRSGGNAFMGSGNRTGGGGAGEDSAGSSGAPGEYSGGGFIESTFFITGNNLAGGGGVGSSGTSESAGRRGFVRVSYTERVDGTYPYVVARTQGRSTSSQTTHSVSMPAGTSVGDFLLIFFSVRLNLEQELTASGWNQEHLVFSSLREMSFGIFTKEATGEDTFSVTTSGSAPYGFSQWYVYVIKNTNKSLSFSASTGNSTGLPAHTAGNNKKHLWFRGSHSPDTNFTANISSSGSFSSKIIQGGRNVASLGGCGLYVEDGFIDGDYVAGQGSLFRIGFTYSLALEGFDPPSVTAPTFDNLTATTVELESEITSDGGATVLSRGFELTLDEGSPFRIEVEEDVQIGVFTKIASTLLEETNYTIRAFASNFIGTNYSSPIFVTTLKLPAVVTGEVSQVTNNTANVTGEVVIDGGQTITERGFVWSTNTNPTIGDNIKTINGTTGVMSTVIDGLPPRSTIYIRAFAQTIAGVGYGDNLMFKTQIYPGTTNTQGIETTSTNLQNTLTATTLLTNQHANSTPATNLNTTQTGIINKPTNNTNLHGT